MGVDVLSLKAPFSLTLTFVAESEPPAMLLSYCQCFPLFGFDFSQSHPCPSLNPGFCDDGPRTVSTHQARWYGFRPRTGFRISPLAPGYLENIDGDLVMGFTILK